MGEHIEAEVAALKQEYSAYLERFHGTFGVNSDVKPLSLRQYCAAAVLCDQAWAGRDFSTVRELQHIMLLS